MTDLLILEMIIPLHADAVREIDEGIRIFFKDVHQLGDLHEFIGLVLPDFVAGEDVTEGQNVPISRNLQNQCGNTGRMVRILSRL